MQVWETIVLALGGNAAILAVLALLAKSIFEKILERDTKAFESQLRAKHDSKIEELKNELLIKATEHQVRFSKLHEKRAEIIAEMYGYLVEMLWEAESFLSPMEWSGEPTKREKYRPAENKVAEFFRFFDKHRIYLPHDLCSEIEKTVRDIRYLIVRFGVYVNYSDDELQDHGVKEKHEAWEKGWKTIKEEMPSTRKALEDRLRALLGDKA